jgi:hypothetical protein
MTTKSEIIISVSMVIGVLVVFLVAKEIVLGPNHQERFREKYDNEEKKCNNYFKAKEIAGNIDTVKVSHTLRGYFDVYINLSEPLQDFDLIKKKYEYIKLIDSTHFFLKIRSSIIRDFYIFTMVKRYKGSYIVKKADSNFFEIYEEPNTRLLKFNFSGRLD